MLKFVLIFLLSMVKSRQSMALETIVQPDTVIGWHRSGWRLY